MLHLPYEDSQISNAQSFIDETALSAWYHHRKTSPHDALLIAGVVPRTIGGANPYEIPLGSSSKYLLRNARIRFIYAHFSSFSPSRASKEIHPSQASSVNTSSSTE